MHMKIGILGTGPVGQTLSLKLLELGHDVIIGTRNVDESLARSGKDSWGNPVFGDWYKSNSHVKLGSFAQAAAHGDILINATTGHGTLPALRSAGGENLNGKILIDISNPLDFSQGFPPSLFVSNTDSLGEQVQREFPDLKVVKTLNTVNAHVMVSPKSLANGDHTLFICGNDADAKASVTAMLKENFGWEDIFDLGDISNARATESILHVWIRTMGVLKTPMFSFKLVK